MLKDFLSDMSSLIYPRVCVACKRNLFKHEQYICNHCYVSLPKTNWHLQNENPVTSLFYGRAEVAFAGSFLLFQKKGNVQKILHALKYKGKPKIAQLLGNWYAQDLLTAKKLTACDFIIPVPLHKKRLQKRGYNQSEYFARGLSDVLKIPVLNDILIKNKFTETQTYKSRDERLENTLHSFHVQNITNINHKKILLVDDVITTGATTEACILQFQKNTSAVISVASIAYTV